MDSFLGSLKSYLFDNLFILIPFHCIITKERIKINVTRSLLSNSILSKDAVAWRHGNLMNENYQVGGLDLLWILLRNCDWFMVEGVWCKHQWKKFYYIIMSLRICSTMLLSDNMIWLDFQAAALRWIITWLRPQKEWICNCTIGSGPIPPPIFLMQICTNHRNNLTERLKDGNLSQDGKLSPLNNKQGASASPFSSLITACRSTLLKSCNKLATAWTSWALTVPGILLLFRRVAWKSTIVVQIHLEIVAALSSFPALLSLIGTTIPQFRMLYNISVIVSKSSHWAVRSTIIWLASRDGWNVPWVINLIRFLIYNMNMGPSWVSTVYFRSNTNAWSSSWRNSM